jgi:hypothetical protein
MRRPRRTQWRRGLRGSSPSDAAARALTRARRRRQAAEQNAVQNLAFSTDEYEVMPDGTSIIKVPRSR